MTGLARRKPLRAQPRGKGNRFERAIVDVLRAAGWPRAYRNFGSGSQGGGDIVGGPADCHLELKHHETLRLWDWLLQAESEARPTDTPIVIFRRNRSRAYAVLPLDDLLPLLALREFGT